MCVPQLNSFDSPDPAGLRLRLTRSLCIVLFQGSSLALAGQRHPRPCQNLEPGERQQLSPRGVPARLQDAEPEAPQVVQH